MTRHLPPPSRVETWPARARRRDRGSCVDHDGGGNDAAAVPAEELPALVWAGEFETGDAKLDGEHRELAIAMNNLTRLLAEGREWSQIVTLTKKLRDKCFAHFHDEEAVLERLKYRKLTAHTREHRYIEKQLDDVLACISSVARPSRGDIEALLYLRPMLIHHFFRYDIAYKSHLLHARSKSSRLTQRKTC
jgi:hemerythrin-like metal-binding protein